MREVHAFCYYTCTKLWWKWETQRRPPAPEVAAPEDPPAEASQPDDAADSAEATEEKTDAGGGSDDGEIDEGPDKPKVTSETKGGKKRKKGGAQFGDRLGLGFDVYGLSGNWEETLDKSCAKIVEEATAAEPDSDYLAKCAR